ncbi:MAG: bifunctional diaminohydroxyphosphoribosylaminopyrimidine deaminase/5-amino-6-(5-phosphoribosylamino)uracil reductase RibD [Victivallales bacterium]|nr:bifunctional diaminohydroxyphosphoribosylaminopyrimidine deaminase/5-amino-6-(5-phosphoribosylamino)uracil reductase RibD [Victivallales bacterium]
MTLEPCCTFGRTPPCTEAVKSAGIHRVVVGCLDPNPKHAGRGVDILRQAGIEVQTGVREEECRELNRAFFKWITAHMPYVVLKMAMTLDGRIATEQGDSKWVTGPEARERVQFLRRWADAVMVGGETARLDNPSLLVRSPKKWPKQPMRLVWTARELPENAQMLHDGGPTPRLVKPQTDDEWRRFLLELGSQNVMVLLLEGGGELAGAALQAGIVDEVAFFVAPKILCGRDSRPVVGGENPKKLSEALELKDMRTEMVGGDLLVTAKVWRK